MGDVVTVPCPIHRRHVLEPDQATLVLIVLGAVAEDAHGGELDLTYELEPRGVLQCAANLLDLGRQQDGYAEHAEAVLEGAGMDVDRHLWNVNPRVEADRG